MSLFRIDLHPKGATIGSCAGALSLDFVIAKQLCPNITVRLERATLGLLHRRQRSEQRLDRSSVFSVISCWICRPRDIASMTRISFRVFSVFRGYIPSAVSSPAVTAFSERVGLKIFLTDGPWIAEPDAGANRA